MDVDVELDIPKFQNGWLLIVVSWTDNVRWPRPLSICMGATSWNNLYPSTKEKGKRSRNIVVLHWRAMFVHQLLPISVLAWGNSTYKYTSYPCIVQSTIIKIKWFKQGRSMKLLFLIRSMLFDFGSLAEGNSLPMVPKGPKNVNYGSFEYHSSDWVKV